MTKPAPRSHLDQGLFLAHFNKAKEAFDMGRHLEAARELEEAYLLRPRDARVLNLLGLVYFKQERFEKAEEIYHKLVTESPDSHTLYFNLGLIYFKLRRLEEAEASFLKALQLVGENPKINFYLGSIYERQRRFQDAIFQYRQAGANIMVRRVETKLAASGPPAAAEKKARTDTARYRLEDIRAAISASEVPESDEPRPAAAGPAPKAAMESAPTDDDDAIVPPKLVEPVNRSLFADGHKTPSNTDTARYRNAATPGQAAPSDPDPGKGTEILRTLDNSLVEVHVDGKVFIKPGTLYSYSGALTFWVKERRSGGRPALALVTGRGKVILRDPRPEVTYVRVDGEEIVVEPRHLLACESSLKPRYITVGEGSPPLEFLALTGEGLVALCVSTKPLPLPVTPELPVSVPASSVITWSGTLTAHLVDDPQLYEAAGDVPGRAGPWVRIEGSGRVLVEQAAG